MVPIKLFEEKKVRSHWDIEKEIWYFSITDIIAILTESIDPLAYWRKLKERLKAEGNETVTNCHRLKMKAGKKGGTIAKNARIALEEKTGRRVVTGENFLPPSKEKKKLK